MTGIAALMQTRTAPVAQATPFTHGPLFLGNEQVRFRLWAPNARSIDLVLGEGKPLPMKAEKGGWFSLEHKAREEERYRYRINGEALVPDPASRFQPEGPNGPSELVAPVESAHWKGRPWAEAVLYELHIGTFTEQGDYAGVESKLDYLKELGITAIELLPIAAFEGRHGWGYDGVLPYAPHAAYGSPAELRQLIEAAHARGIMVVLDVVYNHFGPSGNYLHQYAQAFFTEKYQTPWGAAIDFEGQPPVRQFFIENALYWITEYGFDGLRFDAVHAIEDAGDKHFIQELGEELRARLPQDRTVHLILENDKNEARHLGRDDTGQPTHFTAQWNDDIHHAFHALLTGEGGGYYSDYADDPVKRLGRCLSEGFAYQGDPSAFREGETRGEPSAHLPPSAFIAFLQNHDQIGNRAMGDRLAALTSPEKLKLGLALLLLNPAPPMLYMGEEWGAKTPFLYFCDFEGELAEAVREGRRKEFAGFPEFSDPEARKRIPDPVAPDTVMRSRLDWSEQERHADIFDHVRSLIALRRLYVLPLLAAGWKGSEMRRTGARDLEVRWHFAGGSVLQLLVNFGETPMDASPIPGVCIWGEESGALAPWTSRFTVGVGGDGRD